MHIALEIQGDDDVSWYWANKPVQRLPATAQDAGWPKASWDAIVAAIKTVAMTLEMLERRIIDAW